MRWILLGALLVISGCSKKKGDCTGAAAHTKQLMTAQFQGDESKGRAAAFEKVMLDRCTTDGWSAEVLDCLKAGSNVDDLASCDKLFTEAQSKANDKAMDELEKTYKDKAEKESADKPPAGDKPSDDKPADKPSDDKPADKPSDDKPADNDKPADKEGESSDKPSEDKP